MTSQTETQYIIRRGQRLAVRVSSNGNLVLLDGGFIARRGEKWPRLYSSEEKARSAQRHISKSPERAWHTAPDGTECCCTAEDRRYGCGCI